MTRTGFERDVCTLLQLFYFLIDFIFSPSSRKRHIYASMLFFLTALPFAGFGQATKVTITRHPVLGPNGAVMSVQPIVEIRDAGNQRVTGSTAQVEIVIASGNGGTLGGTRRINAVDGIATFSDLSFSGLSNESYIFEFRSTPLIAYEPFNYGSGTLTGNNGGSGWSGAWSGPNGVFPDLSVNTTGLTYTNFTTSGGCATFTSGNGADGRRDLAAMSNATYSVVWLAFLGNYTQQGGGFNNLRLFSNTTTTGGVGGNDNYSNWTILNSSLVASSFSSIPLNGTKRLALLRIDYTAGTSSLWLDPTISSFNGTQTPAITMNFAPVFNRIEVYNRYSGVSTDEITLASTYKAALHLEQNLASDLSAPVVLPVKLRYFRASCKDGFIVLKWGTGGEESNSHFMVESSFDGHNWISAGRVEGRGTNSLSQDYQFTDQHIIASRYYRLRQVDKDGRFHLSGVESADCSANRQSALSIYPNPAGNILHIYGAAAGTYYQLFDSKGQSRRTGITSNNSTIDMAGLSKGVYFLKLGVNKAQMHTLIKASN